MNKIKYNIALVIANLIFGANYSFYSSLLKEHFINFEGLYVLRTLSTALFFVPFMFITKQAKVDYRDIYKFAIVAVLLIFGRQYLMLDGMNYTSPIDGSIIATLGPIMIMIISAVMIKEKITIKRTLGIILGGIGALILILSNAGATGLASGKMLGNIMILTSILLSSVNTVFVKKLFEKYSIYTVIGWASMIGIAVVLPVFGGDLMKTDLSIWNTETYGTMVYLLLIGTVGGTVLLYYGLKGVSATASSIYAYTQPVIATILAVVRGQDKVTIITLSSAALIFAGVFFVVSSYEKKKAPQQKLEI